MLGRAAQEGGSCVMARQCDHSQEGRVELQFCLLTGCVTLGKLLNLSGLHFTSRMKKLPVSGGKAREYQEKQRGPNC